MRLTAEPFNCLQNTASRAKSTTNTSSIGISILNFPWACKEGGIGSSNDFLAIKDQKLPSTKGYRYVDVYVYIIKDSFFYVYNHTNL